MKPNFFAKLSGAAGLICAIVLTSSLLLAQQKQSQDEKEVGIVLNRFWSSMFALQKNNFDRAAMTQFKKSCDWPLTFMPVRAGETSETFTFATAADFDKIIGEEASRIEKSKKDSPDLEKQSEPDRRKFIVTKGDIRIVSEGVANVVCEVPYRRINPRFGKPFWLEGRVNVTVIMRKKTDRKSGQHSWKVVFAGMP